MHYCFRNVYGVSHYIFIFLIMITQLIFLIFEDDTMILDYLLNIIRNQYVKYSKNESEVNENE